MFSLKYAWNRIHNTCALLHGNSLGVIIMCIWVVVMAHEYVSSKFIKTKVNSTHIAHAHHGPAGANAQGILLHDLARWEIISVECSFINHNNMVVVANPKEPVVRRFGVSFVADLNKLLNKRSNCRWFQSPRRSCLITLGCVNYKVAKTA